MPNPMRETSKEKVRNKKEEIKDGKKNDETLFKIVNVFQQLKDKSIQILQHQWKLFSHSSSNHHSLRKEEQDDDEGLITPPYTILRYDEYGKFIPLLQLENYLNKRLMNQEIAIKTICYCLLRQSTIWSYQQSLLINKLNNKLPLSLFFIGPIGSGKLYLSKLIANSQGRPHVLIDLKYFTKENDLNNFVQFTDEYRYKKPKNYLLGQLNCILEQAPNAIIVLNNLEFAHPVIFQFLHQLFRTGFISEQKVYKPTTSKENIEMTAKINENNDTIIEQQQEKQLVQIIDASQAIFICVTAIDDQFVKTILSSGSNDILKKFNNKERKEEDNNNFSSYQYLLEQREDDELPLEEDNLYPIQQKRKKKSTLFDNLTNQYSTLDALDRVIEFRFQVTPLLVQHLNNSCQQQSNQQQEPKCFESFIHQFNAIIPFFAFTDIELCNQIMIQLRSFKSFAFEQKHFLLTWSEDVIIWLMKRYRPSIHLTGLLENHVLTPLAAADHLFKRNDHIHLDVSIEFDKIIVNVLNRRNDLNLNRSLSLVQSKL
ncbi:hypothetical protein ABK040_008448 [Willaertia magna]